jgi:hypothetical protein
MGIRVSKRDRKRARGQSLVEFAIVFPVLFVLLGGVIQFGLIFWAQNTLTQVVHDAGRWASTQQTKPCDGGATAVVAQTDEIARHSGLLGYSAGQWSSSVPYGFTPAPREGLEISWPISTDVPGLVNTDCPADSSAINWVVNIRAHHVVPMFFPFIGGFIPSCNSTGCSLAAEAQFRMEPIR